MPLPDITDDERRVLETIFRAFVESDDWPTHAWLEDVLERDGIDLNATLEQIEPGLYWPDWRPGGTVFYTPEAQLGLRVAGLAVCPGAERHVQEIVAVTRWLVAEWRRLPVESPQAVPRVEKRTADLIDPLKKVVGSDPLVSDLKLMLDLMRVEPGLPSWAGDPNDILARTFTIDRDVRRFSSVETIEGLVDVLRPPKPVLAPIDGVLELEEVGQPTINTAAKPSGVEKGPSATGEGVGEGAPPLLSADAPRERSRRRRKYRHQSGATFGRWTVRTQLGAGGNAEVWQAEDSETGELAAVKIVHADRTDDNAYARFRREVDAINELAAEGARVLPIIDYFLPEDLTDSPWYAMPVATEIRLGLARAATVDRVSAFAEVAGELAQLADRGWHHRDIKPQNLYMHAGRFVVGDFGLIKRPEDEDLTRPHHVPGPYQYMPNEAVMRSEDIDYGAVDLYCFAKSLWVVLTSEERPPQGQISAGSPWSLAQRLQDESRMDKLDQIIEQATSEDPGARGSFNALAAELASWAADCGGEREIKHRGDVASTAEPRSQEMRQPQGGALMPLTADSAAALERLVVDLMRSRDEIGLRELVREERRRLEEVVRAGVVAKYGTATYGDVAEFWHQVEPAFERMLAVTLPLVAHRSTLWDGQLRWIARFGETRLLDQGLVMWIEMSSWCACLFGSICGGFAMADENLDVVESLLTTRGATVEGEPIGLMRPGESGVNVGVGIMSELAPQQRYLLPHHEYTLRYLGSIDWLRERYGEFAGDAQTLRRWIDDFNFVATLAAASVGRRVSASWTMSHDGGVELARRIRTSKTFRDQIARAAGVTGEEIATRGSEMLRAAAVAPSGFINSNVEL